MRVRNRLITVLLTLALVAVFPISAVAEDDAPTGDAAPDHVSDNVRDKPSDKVTDRITDRPGDKVTDRITDRPTYRCHPRVNDHPRRCVDKVPEPDRCDPRKVDQARLCIDDHHPDDFNVRQQIWRLIQAHEWEKLIRLLHWLGWL